MKNLFMKRYVAIVLMMACIGVGERSTLAQNTQNIDIAGYGVIVEPLPSLTGAKTALCVINTQNEGAQWFVLDAGMNRLLDGIEAAFYLVDSVSVSPDGKYAAVLSVGEGHPILEAIDLRKLLDQNTYTVLHSINPYPGIIQVEGWEGAELHVASDMLLTGRDPQTGDMPEDMMLAADEVFALNVLTGMVRGVSEGAQNPSKHYANVLMNPQTSDSEKGLAVSGLLQLQTIELTVDDLMKILEQERKSERILKLLEAVEKVRQQGTQ